MKYDILIIGSGPGGYVGAIRASQLGRSVAIVEKSDLGGVCLNWGCIPTKALLKSASIYEYARNATQYGVNIEGEITPDWTKIVERSRTVASNMSKGVTFLLQKNRVDVIKGTAQLIGAQKVLVKGETEQIIEAEHIIIATGARPRELPTLPIDGERVINSKHALSLPKLPESMVVVGSGAIGSEFAFLFATLGVMVSIIEYLPNIMPLCDEEVSKTMERTLRKLKIATHTATTLTAVRTTISGCEVDIESAKGASTITAEIVLSAVGIQSNLEELGLVSLGIEVEKGKIKVDEVYRTNIKGIYAIGDVINTPALAHVASAEAICCVENICGANPSLIDYTTIPSCIYTSPEVASVGLTEKQAIDLGYELAIGRFPFTASGKAVGAGMRDGFVKLIFDKSNNKLLGAHMVGINVTEIIAEPTLAKGLGATAHAIARTIHAHPTMNEAIMEAAEVAMGAGIHV